MNSSVLPVTYTVPELKLVLRLGPTTIRQLIREGELGFLRSGKKKILVSQEHVNDYFKRKEHNAIDPKKITAQILKRTVGKKLKKSGVSNESAKPSTAVAQGFIMSEADTDLSHQAKQQEAQERVAPSPVAMLPQRPAKIPSSSEEAPITTEIDELNLEWD